MSFTITSQSGFNEITGSGTGLDPYILDNTADDNLFVEFTLTEAGTIYYQFLGNVYCSGLVVPELIFPPNVDYHASSYDPFNPDSVSYSGDFYTESSTANLNRTGNISPSPLLWSSWSSFIYFVPAAPLTPTSLLMETQPSGVVSGSLISYIWNPFS